MPAHFHVPFRRRCSRAKLAGQRQGQLNVKTTEGQFLNAMKTESRHLNENVYIGIQSTDPQNEKSG